MRLKIYNKGVLIVILLLMLSFFVYCLIEGSELLIRPIIKDPYLPFGTFIGWFVLVVIPFLILSLMEWLGAKKQLLSFYTIGKIGLWMGLLWGLVSFGLSGNFSFSFRGGDLSTNLEGIYYFGRCFAIDWSTSFWLGGTF
ncbi:MAG: hypothetical protein MK226_06110 [Saprospiraceae bacterium]|nr:hypothetical protein [Saprospiraceae bacterium]